MVTKTNQGLTAARHFVHAVEQDGVHLQAAYLFGSFAKGTAKADSDIDVALVSNDLTGWVDDLPKIRTAILTTDARIESVRFHPRNFRDENPLVWEIKSFGIPLISNSKRPTVKRKPRQRTKRT